MQPYESERQQSHQALTGDRSVNSAMLLLVEDLGTYRLKMARLSHCRMFGCADSYVIHHHVALTNLADHRDLY